MGQSYTWNQLQTSSNLLVSILLENLVYSSCRGFFSWSAYSPKES